MKNKRKHILIFLTVGSVLFLWNCSGSKEVKKDAEEKYVEVKEAIQEMNVRVDSIYAWVNLMPGGPK